MTRLDASEAHERLAALPRWRYSPARGGTITREFVFADFAEAFGFMSEVALAAERRHHHPEWSNAWNRVTVTLTTHDADGLSMNDIELAALMEHAFARRASPRDPATEGELGCRDR